MEIYAEYEIAAPADEVWGVIGERFGDLRWSSGITDSYLEGELGAGAERVCHFPPNMFARDGVVHEKLRSFDRESMKLSYEAVDLPGVMKRARNRWTIIAIDDSRCKVEMHATAELRGPNFIIAPFMKPMLRRMGMKTLDELAEHVASQRQDDRHAVAQQLKSASQV